MGRTRRSACRPRPDVGFARGSGPAAGSGRRSGASSDVGIPGRSGGPRAKLGDAHAWIASRRWSAHLGCAGAFDLAAACSPTGRPGAGMGSARRPRASGSCARGTHFAHAERAFVEPASSGVGGSEVRRPGARGARLERLGRSSSRRRRAAADRRAVMGFRRASAVRVALTRLERARSARMGRAQDRGTGGTRLAVLVGARRSRSAARSAGSRTTAVERAVSSAGSRRGSGMENPGPGAGRASRREHNGRRALRRRQLTSRPGCARVPVTPTVGGSGAFGLE